MPITASFALVIWNGADPSKPILLSIQQSINMNSLTITHKMLDNAQANKCVGWLSMNPLDFLRLTTTKPNVFDWIRQEEDDTKSLAEYNKYAATGNAIHMPWLDVDMHTGKVVGHEGRHRAIAVYSADSRQFPVSFCLRERGYPVYYRMEETHEGYPYNRSKKFVTKSDVPTVLVGQFVHREVPIDTSKMVEFWADRNSS